MRGDADGRAAEWLGGVRLAPPEDDTQTSMQEDPITDAERLRAVHLLITGPERDGGAGITPGLHGWNYVDSIFPLHDPKFNRVHTPNPGLSNVLGMDSILVAEVVRQG